MPIDVPGVFHPEKQSLTSRTRPAKLVATMLSGNSEEIVVGAIESVLPWIDELLLIDTGISDATIDLARKTAGEKLVLTSYAWSGDFATVRNAAIMAAQERGATWAMTPDTDERINLARFVDGQALMNQLDSLPDIETWLVAAEDDSYTKERFIRLPSPLKLISMNGRFIGPFWPQVWGTIQEIMPLKIGSAFVSSLVGMTPPMTHSVSPTVGSVPTRKPMSRSRTTN